MARPKEALISEAAVVAATCGILEKDGMEAFNLRRLAKEMNINSASLYHHFASKADILRAVARHVLRQIDLPPVSENWQEWIVEASVQYHRLLIARPFLIPIMIGGYRPRTTATTVSQAKLVEAGVPEALHGEIILSLEACVIGSALVTIMASNIEQPDNAGDAEGSLLRLDHERMLRRTIAVLVQTLLADAGVKTRPLAASA